MAEPVVVVVTRDPALRAEVAEILAARGHRVRTTPRPGPALAGAAVVVTEHDLLPLATPARVLALAGDADEAAIVAAFATGAHDVVAGPPRPCELASRVAVLLRAGARPPVRVGSLTIDGAGCQVRLEGRRVELSRREHELLCLLAAAPGRVFTKQELLDRLWSEQPGASSRRVDTQIARLRSRLGAHRGIVVTVWGVGYRLGA